MTKKWTEEQIIEDLKNKILSGELEENNRLSEREVCEMYNVSRSTVRIVFSHLKEERWVYVKPQSGTYIAPIDVKTINNLFQLRQLLEPQLLIWNINNFTDDDIERMKKNCEIMSTRTGIVYEYAELDNHSTIKERTDNPIVVDLLNNMVQNILRITSKTSVREERRKQAIYEWGTIVNCIERRDADTASKYMLMHLINTADEFWKNYGILHNSKEE